MRKIIFFKLIFGSFLVLSTFTSCKKDEVEIVPTVLTIKSISVTPEVIALGDNTQLSCELDFTGTDDIKDIQFQWSCNSGTIKSYSNHSTYWTPNATDIGNFTISLTVTHDGKTANANTFVKVVKSPAKGWGSVSGYLYDSKGVIITNTDIVTATGEAAKSNDKGFFIISDIPKGINSLNFPSIKYSWTSDFRPTIEIESGSHVHLGNITLYESIAPKMLSATSIHGRRILLKWAQIDQSVYQFIDIYQGDTKILRLSGSETSILMTNSTTGSATFTAKSVPFYGKISNASNSVSGYYLDAIDPNPEYSYFEYHNFYSATLHWRSSGFENFLSGYKIGMYAGYYWQLISSLLTVSTTSYNFSTDPGSSGAYYVISIADDGTYNDMQSSSQKINMNAPKPLPPANFLCTYNSVDHKNNLSWDKITINTNWYSGYLIKRAEGITPGNELFKTIFKTSDMATSSYSQTVTTGITYNYRVFSFSIKPNSTDTTFSAYTEKIIKPL